MLRIEIGTESDLISLAAYIPLVYGNPAVLPMELFHTTAAAPSYRIDAASPVPSHVRWRLRSHLANAYRDVKVLCRVLRALVFTRRSVGRYPAMISRITVCRYNLMTSFILEKFLFQNLSLRTCVNK